MSTPMQWPPAVAPGQTITDVWGNQVVAGIRMAPVVVTGKKTGLATPGGGVDNRLDLTGASRLHDPYGLLFAQGIYIQGSWVGLWTVHTIWSWPSPNDGDITVWHQYNGVRYAQASTFYNHNFPISHASTSTVIPVTVGEAFLEFHLSAFNLQNYVDVEFAAHWTGPLA